MKLAIVGSREFTSYSEFKKYVAKFSETHSIDMIVSGGAVGTDTMAYRYAVEHGITFVCHPPVPGDGYPQKFFRRNLRIVEMADFVLAFPKGKSTGTRHSVSLAKKLMKPVEVVEL